MTTIRFYKPNPKDWLSMACYYGGSLRHDMSLSHVALEWDGGITDYTSGGFNYYTVNDEIKDRPPEVILYINTSHSEIRDMYERAKVFAAIGSKLTYGSLFKKMLDLPMRMQDILCTDYIQLILGEDPQHLTPMEMLDQYFPMASQLVFSEYGRQVFQNGEVHVPRSLSKLWESR
jgi:hypothetical protein